MSTAWRGGSTRRWRAIRATVLATNLVTHDGRCAIHLDGHTECPRHPGQHCHVCTGQADTVHHTKGRARTGDDPHHLVAACNACNLHIGDPSSLHQRDPPPTPITRW